MQRFLRGVALACAVFSTTTAIALANPHSAGAPDGVTGPLMELTALGTLPSAAKPRPEPREYVHPVHGEVGYGEAMAQFGVNRGSHVHQGQDVFASDGTPLVAVTDSVVVETGSGDGRGNFVALYDPHMRRTYVYFHMQRPASVEQGERVDAGERVGRVGCTGSCFGTHLHFEVRRGRDSAGPALDPLPLLERWARR